jgi:hypothetical protein
MSSEFIDRNSDNLIGQETRDPRAVAPKAGDRNPSPFRNRRSRGQTCVNMPEDRSKRQSDRVV